jgi:uncharacterized integral membrane protein
MNEPTVYQGQFGEYTIDRDDRLGVIIYRGGLVLAASCLAIASSLVLSGEITETRIQLITPLFALFSLGLAVSLVAIHIYLKLLHRLLQLFWAIGTISAVIIGLQSADRSLALSIYENPLYLVGAGFSFAALTGIYFKEAFCFDRLETKILTLLVPLLLLGHLFHFLTIDLERFFLLVWAIFFLVFAARKMVQDLDPDVGDKSVFAYLQGRSNGRTTDSSTPPANRDDRTVSGL